MPCSITGCNNEVRSRGWCATHYMRWKNHGDPNAIVVRRYKTPEEAFAARTEWRGDCLVWVGGKNPNGYGSIRYKGTYVQVHRYAYEVEHGIIPKNRYIDHMCYNRLCVNVAHLRLVTSKQNRENSQGPGKSNMSGYLGVSWHKYKKTLDCAGRA